MSSIPTYSLPIIKLLLAAILLLCLSVTYANGPQVFEISAEEMETLEIKDSMEEKEFNNKDMDEDDAAYSFDVNHAFALASYCPTKKNVFGPPHKSEIFLPPPER